MLLFICTDVECNPGPRISKSLIISHTNTRSLYSYNSDAKVAELEVIANDEGIDILCMSETWLDSTMQ